MKRVLTLVGMLCIALLVAGCEPKATQAPGGATEANPGPEPAAVPAPARPEPATQPKPEARPEPAPELTTDALAPKPGSQPALGIPDMAPPQIDAPRIERKAEPAAKTPDKPAEKK